MTALPDVLTVAQLAELLDCGPETIEDRTRERKLPGLKFGRSWVYPRDAVLQVLQQQALAHVRPAGGTTTPSPAPAGAPAPAQGPAQPPAVVALASRMQQRPTHRQRGRTPAPLPDPPLGAA